jgi:acyl-coenzyme A thioesterase PaaI-like protein
MALVGSVERAQRDLYSAPTQRCDERGTQRRSTSMQSHSRPEVVLAEILPPWARVLELEIELMEKGRAVLRLPFSDQLATGGAFGDPALFAAAEAAMRTAMFLAVDGAAALVLVEFGMNVVRPVRNADAVISARVERLGRAIAFCSVDIRDAGAPGSAAVASGTYAHRP